MLYGKEVLKHLCARRLGFGLAALSGLVLLTIVAADATRGDSALSREDMEGIVGGVFYCCDDCEWEWKTFNECWHNAPNQGFAECEYEWCMHWAYSSASCKPDQSVLDEGCDTIAVSPPAPASIGYLFSNDILCPEDPWTEEIHWASTFFGCDTCCYTCSGIKHVGYCEKSSECDGTFEEQSGNGVQYECGC